MLSVSSSIANTLRPARNRRIFPVSVKLFAGIQTLLVIAGLVWFGVPALRQELALREIERTGGHVHARPEVPYWLRHSVQDFTGWRMECFDKIEGALLGQSSISDDGLARLTCLMDLDHLNLADTDITDAGLVHLAGFSKLRDLSLPSTQVTGAGLRHLRELSQLNRLHLHGTQVSDIGLNYLASFKTLELLGLSDTSVSDVGLQSLASVPNLRVVFLQGTKVTPAGVAEFKRIAPNVHVQHDRWHRSGPTAPDSTRQPVVAGNEASGRPAD